MICTALPIVDPVFGRLLYFYGPPLGNQFRYQMVTFAGMDLVLLWLLLRETVRLPSRAVLFALAALFVMAQIVWLTAFPSETWTGIARWFRALPLT